MMINRRQSLRALIRNILLFLFAGAGFYAWQRDRIDINGTSACSSLDCASCQDIKFCTKPEKEQTGSPGTTGNS